MEFVFVEVLAESPTNILPVNIVFEAERFALFCNVH